MKKVNLVLIHFLILIACKNVNEIKDIQVLGVVYDSDTKEPLANAQVMILCWKESALESGDVDYVKKEVSTDGQGKFNLLFEKGFKIDVGAIKKGFQPRRLTFERLTKEVNVQLPLEKVAAQNNVSHCESNEVMNVTDRTYYSKADTLRELIGLNLFTGSNTTNLTEAHLWVEINKNKMTLKASRGNGLRSFDGPLEDTAQIAPNDGYQDELSIQGNEAGFWVKLGDDKGFVKILLSESFDRSVPDKEGYFKEVGLSFRCADSMNDEKNRKGEAFDMEEFVLKGQ
jgi:hypothetical protein